MGSFAYDLVSHGTNTQGQNECYGDYNSTTQIGYGPGYENSCIHSGSNEYSSGDTVWYNYVMATAGTINDENTTEQNPATNASPATESICPKGWTLPSKTQIQTIGNSTTTYVSSFSPVLGGYYRNGTLNNEAVNGYWWNNEAYNGVLRYFLYYNGSSLYTTNNGGRRSGLYVRCVVKKNTKTLSNLTYMQDMTPQTSFWTLVNGRSYDEV